MANDGSTISSGNSYIPTTRDAEISGVWQNTTAKRDKLGELKSEAGGRTLDDMATEVQRQDLFAVDGLRWIVEAAAAVDRENDVASNDTDDDDWISAAAASSDESSQNLHEPHYMALLTQLEHQVQQRLSKIPPERCLRQVEDFYDIDQLLSSPESSLEQNDTAQWKARLQSDTDEHLAQELREEFTRAAERFRLQYTAACIQQLKASWSTWTTLTDQETDRRAVSQQQTESNKATTTLSSSVPPHTSTIPRHKIVDVIQSYWRGAGAASSTNPIDSLWRLVDHDDDGMIDQASMEKVCRFVVATAQEAVPHLVHDCWKSRENGGAKSLDQPKKPSWWQRRRQRQHNKLLEADLKRTLKNHFDVELEINHRLRCIYAWANKQHQDNKIDSVVVDESAGGGVVTSVMGRKRYVELHPKLSLEEFRQVQSIHFPQIDRVVSEYLQSYRDELLVRQGRRRQRQELLREGSLFFVVVCLADYIILSL